MHRVAQAQGTLGGGKARVDGWGLGGGLEGAGPVLAGKGSRCCGNSRQQKALFSTYSVGI